MDELISERVLSVQVKYPKRVSHLTPLAPNPAANGRRPRPGSQPTLSSQPVRPYTPYTPAELAPWAKAPTQQGTAENPFTPSGRHSANAKRRGHAIDILTAPVRARTASALEHQPQRRGGWLQPATPRDKLPYAAAQLPAAAQASADLSRWPPKGYVPPLESRDGAQGLGSLGLRFTDEQFPASEMSLADGWTPGLAGAPGKWLCSPPLDNEEAERYSDMVWSRAALLRADTKPDVGVNPLRRALPLFHPRNRVTGGGTVFPTDVVAKEGGVDGAQSPFLSVLVALARRAPILVERLIRDLGHGRYAARFQDFGEERTVVVDEFLPCLKRTDFGTAGEIIQGGVLVPAFAQISGGVLWPALLQKAFAKYSHLGLRGRDSHGSYHAVSGLADPGDALALLLGAPLSYTTCNERNAAASDELWTAIGHAHKQDYVVCAGCDGSRTSKADQLRLKGLEPLKAYGVCATAKVTLADGQKEQMLVQLRSPSGGTAWQEAWGPNDNDNWTPEIRAKVSELCDTNAEECCFWMGWDDFIREFHGVYVCHCRADWERAAAQTTLRLHPPPVSPEREPELQHDDSRHALPLTGEGKPDPELGELESRGLAEQQERDVEAKRLGIGATNRSAVAYFHIRTPDDKFVGRSSVIAISQRDLRHRMRGIKRKGYAAAEFRVVGAGVEELNSRGHALVGRSECAVGQEVWLECELAPNAEYMVIAEVGAVGSGAGEEDEHDHHGAMDVELSCACWRQGQQQQQPDEETDEEDDELLALEAAGVAPAQEQEQEQAVEEAEEARQLRREGAAIWRRSSGVTVSATDEEAAWARLTRWYSARIEAGVGVGTPYEVGNDGDTVRWSALLRVVITESHRGSAANS